MISKKIRLEWVMPTLLLISILIVSVNKSWSETKLSINTPSKSGIKADQEFIIKWSDNDSGDAIITWFYTESAKGKNPKRIATLFHDDFENGATESWEPRPNSRWVITRDPDNPDNLIVSCQTANEYLGTVKRDFSDVVVSARTRTTESGIAVRYSPEGETSSYRLRCMNQKIYLWKRPGNTGISELDFPREAKWITYELAVYNLENGSPALEGWVISENGDLLLRIKGVDEGQNQMPKNIEPAGIALHSGDFDDVYVDPISARFIKDKKNSLRWDTSNVPDGTYYIMAEIREGDKKWTVFSKYPIKIQHSKKKQEIGEIKYGWGLTADAEEPRVSGQPTRSELKDLQELGKRVKGFVVWESNRSGHWELYRINTDGTGFKQLTQLANEVNPPYDAYLIPRVSHDGKAILFAYSRYRAPVEVWIMPSEGGKPRKLTQGRPLNWSKDDKKIFFIRDYQVWQYELESGKESLLHSAKISVKGDDGNTVGSLSPDLSAIVYRSQNSNEYFVFSEGKTIKTMGGCEPGISESGEYVYWVNGPKDFRIWNVAKNEERQFLGEPPVKVWNYTYFPSVSNNDRWITYGASPNQHDHNTSDYEVYIQELNNWNPVGKPVRLSWDPSTDRWPYLWASK